MSVKVRPRGSRVVVRRDEAETVSGGGIIIPETAKQDRPTKGVVLAVGPGRRSDLGAHIPITGIAEGDSVLFTKFAGDGFKVDGDEVFLVKDEDIIAVILPGESDAEAAVRAALAG